MSSEKKEGQKELLFSVTANDCDWNYFCSGGPGGQRQNKVATACRCVHKASKAVGECRTHASQGQNKKEAFKRMANTPEFANWLKIESARHLLTAEDRRAQEDRQERIQKSIEASVDAMMTEENLKVEMKDAKGRWVPYVDTIFEPEPVTV
mgnify:FL=1